MRSTLTFFAAFILVVSIMGSAADAAPPRAGIYERPRVGVLTRLIELERRKNAWLRRTFLGR